MTVRARRGLALLLLFVLVAAQALALVHRASHGGPASVHSAFQQHDAAGPEGNWAAGLLSGHADDPSCHVFDQVGQGGAVFALPHLALPAAPALQFLRWFEGEALARFAALFEARGPPTLR